MQACGYLLGLSCKEVEIIVEVDGDNRCEPTNRPSLLHILVACNPYVDHAGLPWARVMFWFKDFRIWMLVPVWANNGSLHMNTHILKKSVYHEHCTWLPVDDPGHAKSYK